MKVSLFDVPYTLDYEHGRRTPKEIIDWGLRVTVWADKYGFSDAFYAEHYTIGREPSPAPDLMIAAASQLTTKIRLGAAAHLLPYHNPVSLAHRLMWLDHMTGGRYVAGIAAGAFPTDAQLFGTKGQNANMTREALEIILEIWTRRGPFKYHGTFWSIDMPGYSDAWQGPHLTPLQRPHPPIALVGAQATSPSLMQAGQHGYLPISQQLSTETMCRHWETYSAGAKAANRIPRRSEWTITRNFFIADTDSEAMDRVVNGEMGRVWRDHVLQTLKELKLMPLLAPIPADQVTVEYLANEFWIVGSPETAVAKLTALQRETGGFGTLMGMVYDYSDQPEAYRRSLELMGTVVAPKVDAVGEAEAALSGSGEIRSVDPCGPSRA